jgi:outer membrane receptor protein involved in Fe transport
MVSVPSSVVLDGGVSIARMVRGGSTVRARFAVENITDKSFVASAFLNPDRNGAGAPVAFEPGMPRTLIVSFSVTRAK